ncbi:non-specific serine,threonine protein kinase [Sarracenia purpurea var. burkii]
MGLSPNAPSPSRLTTTLLAIGAPSSAHRPSSAHTPSTKLTRRLWFDSGHLVLQFGLVGFIPSFSSVIWFHARGSCLHILKAAYPDGFEEVVIATILHQVLKGLEYLHHHGHVHRDVNAVVHYNCNIIEEQEVQKVAFL